MKQLITLLLFITPVLAHADFMDADWAAQACEGWNANETLTSELAGKWVDNNGGRGYKTIRMYRRECGADTKVQMTLEPQDGKAICTYGGAVDDKVFVKKYDYLMFAKDKHWTCMGAGKCKAMGAMMSRKLRFKGPKMEAMGVMGPFNAFLKLTGDIPGEKVSCK